MFAQATEVTKDAHSWFANSARLETRPDTVDQKVKVPTMGIWSTGDRYTGEKQMQETAKYMAAEWRYERVENSTHWTMLDQPEQTNRLLLDWLQKD